MITIVHYPDIDIEIDNKTGYKHSQTFFNGSLHKVVKKILEKGFNIKINQKSNNKPPYKVYTIYISKKEI